MSENSIANTSVKKDTSAFQLIQLYLKKWWLLGIVAVVGGIAGILYANFQKAKFESRLTFSLDAGASEGALSSAMSLAAQFGLGFGSGQSMFDGDNILEIMRSRRMVESVLLSTDSIDGKPTTLIQYYLNSSGLGDALQTKPHLKNIQFPVNIKKENLSYLQDSVLYLVYNAFTKEWISASRPDKKLSIYEVNITSFNERFSKVFTDRLVESTSSYYAEITSKKDRETLDILEQRVQSLKGTVNSSIETRASSQDANVNPAFAKAQSPLLKEQYNMQAYGEAYKEMFKTLEMARYQYLKKIPLLQVIDAADYPMRKIKPGKIKTGILFSILSILLAMLALWAQWVIKEKRRRLLNNITCIES